jgi:putative colanic acid biosynthesis acetyltransferase WcaF
VSPLPPDSLTSTAAPLADGVPPLPADRAWVDLSRFANPEYDPGRGVIARTLWYYVSLLVFESGWLPLSGVKRRLLRLFGARIGEGVVIKPQVRIKYPWRLAIGDHCWIGQDVWIDNIDDIRIGSQVCVSQYAYLCTGSHDPNRIAFDLIHKPIVVEDGAWLAARCTVLPGVTVGANAIVAGGSVVTRDVEPATIVAGVPARKLGDRQPPTR